MITLHSIDLNGDEELIPKMISISCICTIDPVLEEDSLHHTQIKLKNGESFFAVENFKEVQDLIQFSNADKTK